MIKKLTALLLVMIMVITAWPCAFASPEYVWANKSTGDLTVTFTEVTAEDVPYALRVRAEDETKADVTVSKDVSLNNSSYYSGPVVSTEAKQNSVTKATIQGRVTGKSDWSVSGLELSGLGKDTVTINKDVRITGTKFATGVRTDMYGYVEEPVYDPNGYSGELKGNEIRYSYYDGTQYVTVYYNKTDNYYYDDLGEKWSYKITPTGAIATATINGDISVGSAEGQASTVYETGTGDATVTIKGNATATGTSATGIFTESWTNSYSPKRYVSISGDLIINATEEHATGIDQRGYQNTDVNVQGKVDVTGAASATGYYGTANSEDGLQSVSIGKELVVNGGKGNAKGVEVTGAGKSAVFINGGVTAKGAFAYGISASSTGYHTFSEYNAETGVNEYKFQKTGGKTTVTARGDVVTTATDGGAIGISATGSGETEINGIQNVEVTGTTGGATGISASNTEYAYISNYNPETKKYESTAYKTDGKTTVTVAGNVKATATDGGANGIIANGTGQVEVTGVQNLEVTGDIGASGIHAGNTGYYINNDNPDGSKTVTATGDVIVKGGTGSARGLTVTGSGDVTISVGRKINVESEGRETVYTDPNGNSQIQRGSDYVISSQSNQNKVNISIGDEVSAKTKKNNTAGVMVYGTGESTVSVSGGVTVEGASATSISASSAGYYTRYELNPETGNYENKFYETDGKTLISTAGNVKATATDGTATAINASGSGKTEVKGVENVEAAGTTGAMGISANSVGYYNESKYNPATQRFENIYHELDGKTTVTVSGSIEATASDGRASGINAGGSGTTEVKVAGDATITGAEAEGIYSNAQGKYSAYTYDSNSDVYTLVSFDIDGKSTTGIDGGLTVKGKHRADGIEIFGSGDNTVIIGKKLTTTSDGYAATDDYGDGETYSNNLSERAVGISLDEGGSATVTIGEGVEATSTLNDVTGVSIDADDEEKVSVTIEDGGLTVATGEEADATAVNIFNAGGHVGVDINGDVVSTGGGINIRSDMQSRWKTLDFEPKESELIRESEDGEYKEYYSADKNVYYDSDGNVWSYVNKGATSVHVVGDVTVNGKDCSAIYISATDNTRYVYDEEGYTGEVKEDELVYWTKRKDADGNIITNKTYYNAEGDFYYDNNGHKWSKEVQDANESETEVLIEGDVTAADTAIMIDAPSETAAVDVIVDGTVAGEEHSIVLTNSTTSEKMMITVWEVKANEQGHLIERIKGHDYTGEEGITIYEQDRDAEQEIQYIIRIAQPEYISTAGTTNYNGYEVAREGDIVYVYLNIPSGYEVNQVYMDDGQTVPVLKDAAGNYYLAVPWGGGVLLSLKMRRRQANLTPAVITLDPNGGTIDGSSEPIQIKTYINKQYVLPEAPEREGATFLGWFESPYGKEDEQWKAPEAGSELLLEPGTRVKIKEKTVYFTAIWAEKSPD